MLLKIQLQQADWVSRQISRFLGEEKAVIINFLLIRRFNR